ncbi:MAG: 4'-phosphopantetheinyl transferase superfamily protein, partial [Clostridia bacterium]|nr:4'-phosphopantetheinyl transferase superfamily protein [Clostridia bacterium]
HGALSPERFRRLAERIAHPAEAPVASPAEAAARWAAKEAAVKLSGRGLATPFRRLLVEGGAVWDETGTRHPLCLVERPGFVAAAVVKATIPAG